MVGVLERKKMAKKRKGSSSTSSRPRTRSKAAKERSKAEKTSESDVGEDECGQLRCEVRSLWWEWYTPSEKQRELEDEKRLLENEMRQLENEMRELEEELQPLRLEVEQAQRNLLPKSDRLKDVCSAIEVENTKHLDKLPPEVWEKIFDELENDDLFPLALSCRYFRQKQKELAARSGQHESGPESGEPRRALKTNLMRKFKNDQLASADYLRFCSKEKVPDIVLVPNYPPVQKKWKDVGPGMLEECTRRLAARQGHLPLLQELLKPLKKSQSESTKRVFSDVANDAGESSSSQFLLRLLCFRF